ncbi:MAG: right-handed parallel beta-helix repeat-containing protein [Candidatus Thorarchaeota archaeon]
MLKKWQLVLVILVLASVQLPTTMNSVLQSSDENNTITIQDQQNPSYVPHSPIIINSNSDFESQGWPGNGTLNNPYVIEGFSIITDGEMCITISNTDVFFIIKDCQISSSSHWEGLWNRGVTLGNVTHGVIENLTISKKWMGIYIGSSSNCSVSECEIYDNGLAMHIHGLYNKEYPENCTIFNNTLYDNREGIHLSHVRHCSVDQNDILGAIYFEETIECVVSNNRIDGSQAGFWSYFLSLYDTVDTLVVNNTMINSGLEFDIFGNPSVQLHNNTVNDKPIGYFVDISDSVISPNDYGQLILVNCDNVTVRDGTISNTAKGVSFYSCSDCIIENVTIYSCGFGAALYWSDNCIVTLSDFHNNRNFGIVVSESTNTIVSANIVYENQGIGIFVPPIGGFGNSFFHNVICSNGEGFTISDGNSWDDGQGNFWDDKVSLGNFWDDYDGTGDYGIPGDAPSVDRYPSKAESVGDSGLWMGFRTNPSEPVENETLIVNVGVIDVDGVDDVILSYSTDGNHTWTNLTMINYGPVWTAIIPPDGVNGTATYSVFVIDNVGNIESLYIHPFSAPDPSTPSTTSTPTTPSTTDTEEDLFILMAIAVGGSLAVVVLALIVSKQRN